MATRGSALGISRIGDDAAGGSSDCVESGTSGYGLTLATVACRVRSFLWKRGGAVSVEAVFSMLFVLVVLGGIVHIVSSAYAADKYRRAAWAAAYQLALWPNIWGQIDLELALACHVIKAELDLDAAFECGTTWTFDVRTGVSPMNLLHGTSPVPDDTHASMVVVDIAWNGLPWSWLPPDSEYNGGLSGIARGVARGEPLD